MAARNDSRVARTVRDNGNHPRIQRYLRRPAQAGPSSFRIGIGFRGRDLEDALADITRRLKLIGAVALTAELAL
jgi:hypothetical protein